MDFQKVFDGLQTLVLLLEIIGLLNYNMNLQHQYVEFGGTRFIKRFNLVL